MSAADLIRTRRSVRTFDGNGLPDEMLEMIREYAETVTNPYGIRTAFTFLSSKEQPLKVPVITGTDMFIAGTVRRVSHAEEAFGYAFEKILLYAWSLGVGSTWIAGTMDRAAFEQAIGLEEGEFAEVLGRDTRITPFEIRGMQDEEGNYVFGFASDDDEVQISYLFSALAVTAAKLLTPDEVDSVLGFLVGAIVDDLFEEEDDDEDEYM